MKSFESFINEAKVKRCPPGKYYCYTDKKCKAIPGGYHVGRGGYLAKDNDDSDSNGDDAASDTKSNGNGSNGNGSGGGNGGNGG